MTRFEDRLVLSRWVLEQFSTDRLETLSNTLSADHLIGFSEENCSKYLNALIDWMPKEGRTVSNDQLRYYDDNIVRHWKQITEKRNHEGSTIFPLYFQYLSLLFTEHYLDRYFTDCSALCDDLNQFRKQFNQDLSEHERIKPFNETDLNKLAVWIATGGGKTLIMHVNILQFKHYLVMARRGMDFNKTILLTPNEGLSLQHKDELDLSDIEASLFVKDGGNLFTSTAVEIIDIHKLKEKSGEKTIAVESFESKNLVLVDEGHRGAGGVDWRGKRNQLCEHGFSFEYSATFGQAIKAASGTASLRGRKSNVKYSLSQLYSRCILFDYSYKYFQSDGYGKDHYILNVSHVWTPEQTQLYLTGCILTFYQQKRLYSDKRKDIVKYLLADPLWIFVGGKVMAKNKAYDETKSDIQAILRFISRFVSNKGGESVRFLELLLNNQDDLRDEDGRAIFCKAFPYLQNHRATDQAEALFLDVLKTIFHANASGSLHVVHLKGSGGEIGLRVGINVWFGLINVGDAAKLIKYCKEDADNNMVITHQAIYSPLFKEINKSDSSINLLVGAKKFTEGWSSWRVSTMGLMYVGRSEGSEIIQLFGRGVRLKGHGFSLKRSNHVPGIVHPKNITLLETLNIFGIRSDYMKEFEACLETEGVEDKSTKIIKLPVAKQLTRYDLKFVRPKQDLIPFKRAMRLSLSEMPSKMGGKVILNWYPKIQTKRSTGVPVASSDNQLSISLLQSVHRAFLNFDEIYFELVQYKNEKGWYNFQFDKKSITDLFTDTNKGWYQLHIPKDILQARDFERVFIWQQIVIALLKKYLKRYYSFYNNMYVRSHLEYYEVRETDDNFFNEYKATVNISEEVWVSRLNELKAKLSDKGLSCPWEFGKFTAINFSQHLYQPLISFSNNDILKISPVPLNDGEFEFVNDLKTVYQKSTKFFDDKELFLLRNQSRGKGVGFFVEEIFYPDFILWLIERDKQYVCFVDPKGLTHTRGLCDSKIRFHKAVKKIQKELGDPNVFLDSFIISNTFRSDINWWDELEVSKRDFANNHVLFQKEEKDSYILSLLNTLTGQDASR